MIKVKSYEEVNGCFFGGTESDAVAVFGDPIRRRKNREQENELYFPDFILRFDSLSGDFREITLLPPCIGEINGNVIYWDERFLNWLISADKDLKEVLGFLLSLKFGIAISGFHDLDDAQKSIHAFRKGDWDIFKNRMRSFER